MKIKSNFLSKLKGVFSSKQENYYYKTIDDLPLYNWVECQKGKIEFVRKGDKGTTEQDDVVWMEIYDQYIKEFGLGKLHIKMLEAMKKKALLQLEYVKTRNAFQLTKIEMQITKLDGMLANKGSGISIEQTLVHLSKWIGQWLNTKKLTTREYFNLVREFERYNKQSNGEANKSK